MKKVFLLSLIMFFSLFTTSVFANSYEYVIDEAGIFDDSNYMVQQANNLRTKMDLNVHIYSVDEITKADEIFDEYIQDSKALILVVSKDGQVDWYSGSVTKKVVRDVDIENILASRRLGDNDHTTYVNEILYDITVCCMGEENVVIDKENPITSTASQESALKTRIALGITGVSISIFVIVFCLILLIRKITKKLNDKKEEIRLQKEREEAEKKRILGTSLYDLAAEEYAKTQKEDNENNRVKTDEDFKLEELAKKYDTETDELRRQV